jgi:hypothetical protein
MKQIRSLKLREKIIMATLVIALIAFGLTLAPLRQTAHLDNEVMAAVTNPSPGSPGYMMMVIPIAMTLNSTNDGTGLIRFKMPWPATLVGASAIVKTTGSGNTVSINVTEAGTSVLSGAITANESTVTEGTVTDSSIADEAVIGINATVSSSTNCTFPTVQLNFKRK